MDKEDLKTALLALKYGEVATLAMVERGPYAEADFEDENDFDEEATDATTGASKFQSSIFTELAQEVKAADEDLTVVKRLDEDVAMTQADFDWFLAPEQLTAAKRLIFLECLNLGTTEIKGFLNTLLERNLLADSKLVLLDLPTIEFMTLRDLYAGKIKF